MKKVLILVNHDVVIYNFRKELVERLLKDGSQVYISSPYGDRIDDLVAMGCHYIETSISRHGTNIIEDLKLLYHYKKIIKDVRPDVVLTYTIKPNIYGGMACESLKVPYIANITGLGTAVENKGIMQKITIILYKIAFKKINCVFFQNTENRQFFIDNNVAVDKHRLIPGSGVNLNQHCFEEYPKNDGIIRFLFVGRIMKAKGIEELKDAATIIKKIYPNVIFDIIGFCEDDYLERAAELEKFGVLNFHGVKDNIHEYIKKYNAVVLPSYHEGMANVLLESAATGCPVLASNIAGCKETFDEGISGFGFKAKNSRDLTDVLIKFINLPYEKKKSMGIAGRRKMENEFDRSIVINAYADEINNIINLKEEN